jgi:hypothetical protein
VGKGRGLADWSREADALHGKEFSVVPDGTLAYSFARPTDESVGYFLSPSGLCLRGVMAWNRGGIWIRKD